MRNMDKILYLYVNDWKPTPQGSESLLKTLGGMDQDWATENRVCVAWEFRDLSVCYWISAPTEFYQKECPELLCYTTESPILPEYLVWMPKNYGFNLIEDSNPEEDITYRVV